MRRAVLWDMDGTLIDSEPVHALAFDAALNELGLAVPNGFHDTLIGQSGENVHRALVLQTGTEIGFADWVALKWAHYKRHSDNIPRREPVSTVAVTLSEHGVPMAVVSNSTGDEVALCLRATGLDLILPVAISRTALRRGKPDPEGYLLAAKKLKCSPEHCLVVEDSIPGVDAGIAAGMTVLFHPQANGNSRAKLDERANFLASDCDPFTTINQFIKTGDLSP